MPRGTRRKSSSGIYHVMLRGVNQQIIFEEDQDRSRFLETLARFKVECAYSLYAYCLMDNHVHLLLNENAGNISNIVQKISTSYANWFNAKYDRSGHLYQGRFRSGVVESDAIFLRVLRYIHQNPIRAGISKHVFNYRWSSADLYLKDPGIVDTEYGLQLFSQMADDAVGTYMEFMNEIEENNDEDYLDRDNRRYKDEELFPIFREYGITRPTELQLMDKQRRDAILREIKQMDGVSIRQLSRITGISRSVIQRA